MMMREGDEADVRMLLLLLLVGWLRRGSGLLSR